MKRLYVKTSNDWKKWLTKNHNKVEELWLIFYKKGTSKPSIDYETAVEEALCFGWIDSLVKKIDEERYVRKFTPRKNNSVWSESNKKCVKRVIKEGRMTEFGMEKITAAKKSGMWNKKIETPKISYEAPKDFVSALNKTMASRSTPSAIPAASGIFGSAFRNFSGIFPTGRPWLLMFSSSCSKVAIGVIHSMRLVILHFSRICIIA